MPYKKLVARPGRLRDRWRSLAVLTLAALFVAGSAGCASSAAGPAASSTDFGQITTPVSPSPWQRLSTASSGVDSVAFADSTHGWIVIHGTIKATDDGGASWGAAIGRLLGGGPGHSLPADPALVRGPGQIVASERHTIWLSYDTDSHSGLLVSRDGGRTWRSAYAVKDGRMSVFDYAWPDPQHGFLFLKDRKGGLRAVLLRSVDAGHTWKQVHTWSSSTSSPYPPLAFSDARHGWLQVGDEGGSLAGLIATGDGGLTWQVRTPPSGNSDAFIVTGTGKLWAVGNYFGENDSAGLLAFSPDGGRSWKNSGPFVPIPLFGVLFADEQRGWIGAASAIYGTRDGGKTWAKELTVPDIAWASGGFGLFVRAGDRILAIRDDEVYVRPL